jgi:2-polyprenyl-6-methoxyphenol hydroxylase-like FAD-dependent oxidoreductase
MLGKQDVEVLIVGAGPVGQFTALSLAERGVSVQIVDEERRTAAHSYALALHPRTLTLLNDVGLEPSALENSLRVDKIAFYDGSQRRAEIALSELPLEFPYLVVQRQSHFEGALEQMLRKKRVRVEWNHRMSALQDEKDGVHAEISVLDKISTGYPVAWSEWEVIKTIRKKLQFVVGADGHRSLVRKILGIETEIVDAPEFFGVFEFECEDYQDAEVRVILDGASTNVLWPLPEGRCRFSFQILAEPEELFGSRNKSRLAVEIGSDTYPHLTDKFLKSLIAERAPWFDLPVGDIFWSIMARFERRLAKRFGNGRVWLAGDAAHLTGPVGVQSMNVGLSEGHQLAEIITRVLKRNASPDSFQPYDRGRSSEWSLLLGIQDGLVADASADEWVAQNRAKILPCIPASGEELSRLVGQLGLRIKDAPTPAVGP